MEFEPYISDKYFVVGPKHGRFVSRMGVTRYVNDIKRVCKTEEEAILTVKQQNTPVYLEWISYEPEELYRITREAYRVKKG